MDVLQSQIDWNEKPPTVTLTVVTGQTITPHQIQLVERLLHQELHHPFRLLLKTLQVQRISDQTPVTPPVSPPELKHAMTPEQWSKLRETLPAEPSE
jgi:hypothetical protein